MAQRSYFLTSPRLGFSEWRDDDLDLAVSLWGDPRVTALFDARERLTREQVARRLEQELDRRRTLGIQYWPAFLRESEDFVGCAGLKPYGESPERREMGVHLRPAFWGRGLATEACRAIVTYAFGELGLRALLAGHHPENHASRRVLEKLGFRHLRDELFEGTGLVHPLYELPSAEWNVR